MAAGLPGRAIDRLPFELSALSSSQIKCADQHDFGDCDRPEGDRDDDIARQRDKPIAIRSHLQLGIADLASQAFGACLQVGTGFELKFCLALAVNHIAHNEERLLVAIDRRDCAIDKRRDFRADPAIQRLSEIEQSRRDCGDVGELDPHPPDQIGSGAGIEQAPKLQPEAHSRGIGLEDVRKCGGYGIGQFQFREASLRSRIEIDAVHINNVTDFVTTIHNDGEIILPLKIIDQRIPEAHKFVLLCRALARAACDQRG